MVVDNIGRVAQLAERQTNKPSSIVLPLITGYNYDVERAVEMTDTSLTVLDVVSSNLIPSIMIIHSET